MSGPWETAGLQAALPRDSGTHGGATDDNLSGPEGTGVAGDDIATAAAEAVEAAATGEAYDYQKRGWAERYIDGPIDSDNATFDGNARVYYWDGEEGDVGPEYPELEDVLFGTAEERNYHSGIDFSL